PTHAAEAAVPLDCSLARTTLREAAAGISGFGRAAIRDRAAPLAVLASGPSRAVRVQRTALNQRTREIRASSERGLLDRYRRNTGALGRSLIPAAGRLARSVDADLARVAATPAALRGLVGRVVASGRSGNESRSLALRAHDPQRTLERGYARVEDRAGDPVTSAAAARRARMIDVRFADGPVPAEVLDNGDAADFEQIRLDGVEDG
ncbi:MAG: hypothetical protein KDB62_08040, partial [Solirubrobacterales bacterium]|nr:hypothetical protein [Solirubrobacterales bacterium]